MSIFIREKAGSLFEPSLVVIVHLGLVLLLLPGVDKTGDSMAAAPIMADLIQPSQEAEQTAKTAASTRLPMVQKRRQVEHATPVLGTSQASAVTTAVEQAAAQSKDNPSEETRRESKPEQESTRPVRQGTEHVSAQVASAKVQAVQVALGGSQNQQHNYLAELMRKLNRHKVYPPELKREKIEGRVLLKFTIAADGQVVFADVQGSSGSSDLDSAAMNMLKRASPLPAIPAWMNRSELTLSIPVEYSLITDR